MKNFPCRYYILPALLLALAPIQPALAQDAAATPDTPANTYQPYKADQGGEEYKSFVAGPYYRMMARQALDSQPADFDFGAFRINYSQTEQYDPLAQDTRDRLLKIAYAMQHEPDKKKRDRADSDYADLIMSHLANIDVVTQAQLLAGEDKRFGDPAFFEWVRRGLTQSLLNSGTGTNLYNAYDVITIGEDTALLAALNVKLLKTDTEQSGGTYYSMHDVKDDTPGFHTVFVNLTVPMAWLEARRRERGLTFTIPRQ